MKSELDSGNSWNLYSISFRDRLEVLVEECVENPRYFSVVFGRLIAWEVVDENYSHYDESEIHEGVGKLQTITASAYLNFVKERHAGFEFHFGIVRHYRIWTEGAVVEVISDKDPEITLVPNNSLQGRRP